MVRTPSCDKSGLRKGTWTPEEDRKLIAYVTRYGCWNWRQLPPFAGLQRCGKSCRLRWMNYLRPNIKRGNFTQEEEDCIIRMHKKLGNRWSVIAAELPGRTDNEVKNHWHTSLKKRCEQNTATNEESTVSKSKYNESNSRKDSAPNNSNGPLSPMSSSSEFSSISSDNYSSSAISKENPMLEDEFGFLDTNIVDGNFWTQSYMSDISNAASEIVPIDANCGNQNQDSTQIILPDAGEFSPHGSSNGSLVLENDDFGRFLDAFVEPTIDSFWTQPYVADVSHVPSEFLTTPMVHESEYFSPLFDADLWSTQSNLYDEHPSLF